MRSKRENLRKTAQKVMSLSDTDLAWLAGIIDGEGCLQISLNNTTKGKNLRAVLTINMTHLPTMEAVASVFCCPLRPQFTPDRKPVFIASIGGKRAAFLIRAIRPYLITKADQADVFLAFTDTLGTERVSVESDTYSYRENLRQQLKSLR